MRRLFILYLISLLLFSSCHSDEHNIILLKQAEHCMEVQPDSALYLLRQIISPAKMRNEMYADYALLMTQAMDKNNLPLVSDSLLSFAVDYYRTKEDSYRKAQVLFYLGKIHYENNEYEEASRLYLQALNMAEYYNLPKLCGLINSYLRAINMQQDIYDEALAYGKRSITFFRKANDSVSILTEWKGQAQIFLLTEQLDSAGYYYEKVYQTSGNIHQKMHTLSEWSLVFMLQDNYSQALNMLLRVEQWLQSENVDIEECAYTDLALGDVYLKMKNYPMAKLYMERGVRNGKLVTKVSALSSLYLLAKEQKLYKDAIYYNDLYEQYNDSLEQQEFRNTLMELQQKYQNEKLQVLYYKKKTEYQFTVILLVASLVCCLIIVGSFYYFYKQYRKRKERQLIKSVQQYRTYYQLFAESDKRLKQAEFQLQLYKEHSDDYEKQKEQIEKERQARQDMEIQMNRLKVICQIEEIPDSSLHTDLKAVMFYRKLRQDLQSAASYTSKEWEFIFHFTDMVSSSFHLRFSRDFPFLHWKDLRLCCLIRLGFSNDEIAEILGNIQKKSVMRSKSRLRDFIKLNDNHTLLNDKLTFEDFDTFIQKY